MYPLPGTAGPAPLSWTWNSVLLELITDGIPPRFVLQGDLNDDGLPDLILGRSWADPEGAPGWLSVYLATEAGKFPGLPAAVYALASGTTCAVLADFDDDDLPDVVTGSFDGSGGGALTLRRGGGDGTFEDPEDVAFDEVLVLASGDFDANGGFDLAAGDGLQTRLYRNMGGSFLLEGTIADAGFLGSGDLGPDLGDELVIASGTGVRIHRDLLGTPAIDVTLALPGAFQVRSLSVADGDGDGDPDILCAAEEAGSGQGAAVWFRNAPGGFSGGEPLLPGPGGLFGAALLDFDGDGFSDVAACRQGAADTLALAFGGPGPAFTAAANEGATGRLLLLDRGPASGARNSLIAASAAGVFLLWSPPIP